MAEKVAVILGLVIICCIGLAIAEPVVLGDPIEWGEIN